MTKRVAIFNGFPFHYEMFGTVLDYLTTHNQQFDVFSETVGNMGWFNVYESRFGARIIHPIRDYNPNNYDYVFLLTDDDYQYKNLWHYGASIIMFEHFAKRNTMRNTRRRIQLRQFMTRNPPSRADTWMLPVWNIRQRPTTPDTIKVVAIGNNCPSNPDELKPWFYDIAAIQFVFINRTNAPTRFDHESWKPHPNVRLLENIDADQMLEEAATADWLMFLPKNANQYQTAISAIHPIVYGVRVPLLMKQEWCDAYGLGGMYPLDPSKPLTKPSNEQLAELDAERIRLFERRDRILEESLTS